MLRVLRHANAAEFLNLAEAALARRELENNLILGVPLRARDTGSDQPENLYLSLLDGERFVGAAAMTPPHNLILHVETDAAENSQAILRAIANDVLPMQEGIPGMIGRVPWVDEFAAIWKGLTSREARLAVSERLFALHEVVWPPSAMGRFRAGSAEDLALARDWFVAFSIEALQDGEPTEEGRARASERIKDALLQGRIFFWEVEEAAGWRSVCMVGKSRALPHGCTIGPVYTPPSDRGRGYASNATAALSALLLEEGWEYATLFTDLSNPTSNSIYQKIGYKPICDYGEWRIV